MPRVLSRIFNLGLFSFLVCSSTGQAGQGGDRAGWHRGRVAGLAACSEGTRFEARDNHLSSALMWHTGLQSQRGSLSLRGEGTWGPAGRGGAGSPSMCLTMV